MHVKLKTKTKYGNRITDVRRKEAYQCTLTCDCALQPKGDLEILDSTEH